MYDEAVNSRFLRLAGFVVLTGYSSVVFAQTPFAPTDSELRAAYTRADNLRREINERVLNLTLTANWLADGSAFWSRRQTSRTESEFIRVETRSGKISPAFDHEKLATALAAASSMSVNAKNLPFRQITLTANSVQFDWNQKRWTFDLKTAALTSAAAPVNRTPPPQPWRQSEYPPQTGTRRSPNGERTASIQANQMVLHAENGDVRPIGPAGTHERYLWQFQWAPDSKRIVVTYVHRGERKPVFLFESSPRNQHRAIMTQRPYDQPGDKIDVFEFAILDTDTGTVTPVADGLVENGWPAGIRWSKEDKTRFTFEKFDRGFGRWRALSTDLITGQTRTLVDEDPDTFVDSTAHYFRHLEQTEEILFRSERTGWGHLYLADATGTLKHTLTAGEWVVREVLHVDEARREVVFSASGKTLGEDPYNIHVYRVGFDGKNLRELTHGAGDHSVQLSPGAEFLVDTVSTPTTAPKFTLRNARTGKQIADLGGADVSGLAEIGWKPPQLFKAKGRDGVTDIWGLAFRPLNMRPGVTYPIIEDIYAGPQNSFVPRSFLDAQYDQALAELGFIVVKIDGMGTRNRGKKFHDVCYKNLADAGLPDRKLWISAFAAQEPAANLGRVGIFGTSAGGQSSTGAVLFHPEFYHVAVSSCGCHDNRIDKIWWNEQWMGYPVGPHYAEQSNIMNAAKLKGKLMLLVGELDDNVPPESTFRLMDALIRAGKEAELVVLPGQTHTSGGTYGERKRRDFFVRHLHRVNPPDWN